MHYADITLEDVKKVETLVPIFWPMPLRRGMEQSQSQGMHVVTLTFCADHVHLLYVVGS